jgi:hypothetical protein
VKIVLVTLLWIGIIMSRPMALGYSHATIGLFFASVAAASAVLFRTSISINRTSALVFTANLTCGLIYTGVLVTKDLDSAVKFGTIVIVFNIAMLLVVACSKEIFLVGTKLVLRAIVLSGCLTSAYFILFDLDVLGTDLVYYTFAIKDRNVEEIGTLRFPLSTIMFRFSSAVGIFPRSSFLAIEPGVAPILIVLWRLSEGISNHFKRIILDAIFVLALASTFSTAVPVVATIFFTIRSIFLSKRRFTILGFIFVASLLATGIALFFFAPGIGYYDKIETHNQSFIDRQSWYVDEGKSFFRYSQLALMAVNFIWVFRYLGPEKYVIGPVTILIAAINVLAFTPIHFACVFLFIVPRTRQIPEGEELISSRSAPRHRTCETQLGSIVSP